MVWEQHTKSHPSHENSIFRSMLKNKFSSSALHSRECSLTDHRVNYRALQGHPYYRCCVVWILLFSSSQGKIIFLVHRWECPDSHVVLKTMLFFRNQYHMTACSKNLTEDSKVKSLQGAEIQAVYLLIEEKLDSHFWGTIWIFIDSWALANRFTISSHK